jgi:hypothetical protein
MKKTYSIIALIIVMTFSGLSSQAIPFYLKVKIGFLAKWSIVVGECEPGWGICIALPAKAASNGFLGYDDQTDQMIVKVSKTDVSMTKEISDLLSIKEDSPIDPRITEQYPKLRGKTVYIKAGTYKVIADGEYFLSYVNYYIK